VRFGGYARPVGWFSHDLSDRHRLGFAREPYLQRHDDNTLPRDGMWSLSLPPVFLVLHALSHIVFKGLRFPFALAFEMPFKKGRMTNISCVNNKQMMTRQTIKERLKWISKTNR